MGKDLISHLKMPIFTSQYARQQGVSPRMLSYFVSKGLLVRVSHGVYAMNGTHDGFDLQSILERISIEIPQGVIGRLSALKYYGLLDESPALVEVIVPTDNIPKRKIEDVSFFCAPRKSLRGEIKSGIETKGKIRVTSLDRTLIECLRTGVTIKVVRDAFEEAQRKGLKPSLSQMAKFADILRVQGKFDRFKESIL
jgi:predicted transcriptional regulator of viral defense system